MTYLVMAVPPLLAGAVHETVTGPEPAEAVTAMGADGGAAATIV
jgi:hypothetical protein